MENINLVITEAFILQLLQEHYMKRGSCNFQDYETAKLWLWDMNLTSYEWYKACQIITDYLEL